MSDDLSARIAAQELLLRALIGRMVMAGTLKPADIEGIVGWAQRLAGDDEGAITEIRRLGSKIDERRSDGQ